MARSTKSYKRIAGGAIFALLFSALSPAFAALQLKWQPAAFTELCTATGIKRVALNDAPLQYPAHHKSIHCAWCTSGASQPALSGPSALWVITPVSAQFKPLTAVVVPAFSAPIVAYHSQAPPVLS
jgi:hypothetical protein